MQTVQTPIQNLKACSECGCIQRLPTPSLSNTDPQQEESGWNISCIRCGHHFKNASDFARMRNRVSALAAAALGLFPAAILLPVIEIEQFGHRQRSSLVGGIGELFQKGEWGIAIVILLFSLVFPLLKLSALLELCWLQMLPEKSRHKVFKWVEVFGKWSMLDVLLLALMVMWIKLSDLVAFQFGPATLAFALCVALSMLASLAFDPRFIWEQADPAT